MCLSKKIILGLIFGVLIFFASFSRAHAFNCSSNGTGGGNFNLATTWVGCNGTTPQTTDSITINTGDTVTLVAATTVKGITINNGGVFAANTRALNNTDLYTNNGSHTGTTSTMALSGSSGTVITGTGSYTPTGIITISTGDKTISSSSHLSFDKITITGVTLTNNSTAGFTILTALAGTGTLIQGSSAILNLRGTTTIGTLNASVNTNEVHYISTTANQTVKAATYFHLFLDKPGRTGTMNGTTNILGNFVSTADTTDFISSFVTITGTTDIYGILKDQNNTGLVTFGGRLTIHSAGSWLGHPAEACNFTFHNGMQYDGGTFVPGGGFFTFDTNNQSITGSGAVIIGKAVVTGTQLTNSNASAVTISTSLSGTGEFVQDTNALLNISGTSTITSLTASASGNTVNYNGTTVQTVHAGTYQTLNVSGNINGNVNIATDTTANTALTLGAVIFSTSSNKMILGTSATVSRTSGYVSGTIEKQFDSSTSFTLDIGDSNFYTPINLTFSGVTGTGSIDGNVTNTDHTDIVNSGIDLTKKVNRYWTLVNNGLFFTSYTAVFNFASGNIDQGANVASMNIAKNSSGTWNIVSSICTGTSCTATGLTSMSDFLIGEPIPKASSGNANSTPLVSPAVVPTATIAFPTLVPGTATPSTLFDILSSPLFPNTGGTISSRAAIIFLAAGGFLIGALMGIGFLLRSRRRRRSRVLRISRRRHI